MKLNPEKLNPTTQRTLDALHDALESLMQKKCFDDIKVGEICSLAKVPRSTFYSYFEDKYDYLEFFLYKFNNIGKNGTFPLRLEDIPDINRRHEAYNFLLDQLENKGDIYRSIYKVNCNGILAPANRAFVKNRYKEMIESTPELTLDPDLLANYLDAIYWVFWTSWLFRKPGVSRQDIIACADKFIDCLI